MDKNFELDRPSVNAYRPHVEVSARVAIRMVRKAIVPGGLACEDLVLIRNVEERPSRMSWAKEVGDEFGHVGLVDQHGGKATERIAAS